MEKTKLEIKGKRVIPKEVEQAIYSEDYIKLGDKIVICHLVLKDGFEVIGKAGVVDVKKFDIAIGSKWAREDALNSVWQHMGSILQDRLTE